MTDVFKSRAFGVRIVGPEARSMKGEGVLGSDRLDCSPPCVKIDVVRVFPNLMI